MPKFTGLSLQTLQERLGRPYGKRVQLSHGTHSRAFHMLWQCDGPGTIACYATAHASDNPMPPDLTPWEQEFFETAPFPRGGWTLKACPRHRGLFEDHPEEPD